MMMELAKLSAEVVFKAVIQGLSKPRILKEKGKNAKKQSLFLYSTMLPICGLSSRLGKKAAHSKRLSL